MRGSHLKHVAVILGLVFVLSCFWLVAVGSAEEPEMVTITITKEKQAETAKYWTTERMEKAKPAPLPIIKPEELEKLLKMKRPVEKPKKIEPIPPEESEAYTDTPERANVRKWPYSTGGVLYSATPTGDLYGSGQFVANLHVIMTAAHLVCDGNGHFYSNVHFVRAYRKGHGQKISQNRITVPTAYFRNKDRSKDYAFICTVEKSKGGALGFRSGLPYSSWWAIGYPLNFESGQYMQKVHGTKGENLGGYVEMKGNPMTGGSSGGAWIGDLTSKHRNNFVIGLISGRPQDAPPETVWSPYFDNSVCNSLTAFTKGCVSRPQ